MGAMTRMRGKEESRVDKDLKNVMNCMRGRRGPSPTCIDPENERLVEQKPPPRLYLAVGGGRGRGRAPVGEVKRRVVYRRL